MTGTAYDLPAVARGSGSMPLLGLGTGPMGDDAVADAVFVTTKLPAGLVGQERRTLESSQENLGRDHVDLWLIYWPPGGAAAPEGWAELLRAREDGLARAVGVSDYSLDQVDELERATGLAPEVNQVTWGPLLDDPAVVNGHAERGVVLEGYSPLKASDLSDPRLVEAIDALSPLT